MTHREENIGASAAKAGTMPTGSQFEATGQNAGSEVAASGTRHPNREADREHLLASIRCASAHMLKAKLDIDSVGTALKGQLITIDEAFNWLDELGVMPLIVTVVVRGNG
jgi:hypothetical protein